jgi:serine phosphatase RsbU (regulator of sigma subunit)/anti-sigma regulatory factor (Ser/Thr protein kinase)
VSFVNDRFNHPVQRESGGLGQGQVFLGTDGVVPPAARPEQLSRIYRLNDPALSDMAPEPLLSELLMRIRELLSVDTVAILLLNDKGDELIARAAKGLEEEVERGVRIPIGKGFAGRIAFERRPIFIADIDHADVLNPILRQKGVRSVLGVPLILEADLVGVLHVGSLKPREFTNEDAAVLQLAATRVAPAIERARLFEALEREHRAAFMLQRSLLPDQLPELAGLPVAARYFPARDAVGGDWYDVMELPRGKVGIAIGDVVGHGISAAALMGQLRTALRAYALDGYEPTQILERLNRLLQTIRGRGMATAAYATFDQEKSTLRFASAGHPPPVIASADGEARLLEVSPGAPLGALPYSSYVEGEVTLQDGDILVLYTDGLVEMREQPLDVGLDRLLEAVSGAISPDHACRQIARGLVPKEGARDDIAFVALQNEPVPAELLLRLPADPPVLAQVRQALRRWLHARGAPDEEIEMITLACGEACANAIEHAYSPALAFFELEARAEDGHITLAVRDIGRWRGPRGENRGRGLKIMKSVMDVVEVNATPTGTEVLMRRRLPI